MISERGAVPESAKFRVMRLARNGSAGGSDSADAACLLAIEELVRGAIPGGRVEAVEPLSSVQDIALPVARRMMD